MGIPRPLRDFQARHFHGQALDSGHFGKNAVLGTTYKVYFLLLQKPRQMRIFPDSCGEPVISGIRSPVFAAEAHSDGSLPRVAAPEILELANTPSHSQESS